MKSFKKIVTLLTACMLWLSALQIAPASADTNPGQEIPDGEYTLTFRYVKDTTQASAADIFMVKDSGKLIVAGGAARFEHEVTKRDYSTFAYMGARKPSANKAVIATAQNGIESVSGLDGYEPITVRDSSNPNHVVIQFAIENIGTKQDIVMHINDTENIFNLSTKYNHWYNAQLELSIHEIVIPTPPDEGDDDDGETPAVTLELFNTRLAAGRALHDNTVEGEYDGAYSASSRTALQNSLISAEALVQGNSGNQSLLEAAYTIVDQAIKKYESLRIVVDKSKLLQWITTATNWAKDAADFGFAETGKPANPLIAAVSDGEYPPDTSVRPISGPVTKVRASIATAQTLVNDALVTQAQINAQLNSVASAYDWDMLAKQRYIAAPANILVLDSIGDQAQLSPHASDISTSAVLLQQAGPDYYAAYANISFHDPEDKLAANDIRQPTLDAASGLFLSSYASSPAPVVKNTSSPTTKVYQMQVRSGNSTFPQHDQFWQGLWKVQYPNSLPEDQRKTVYISFNKDQLDILNQLIDEAQELYDEAVEGTEAGQYSAIQKTKLQEAITLASETGSKLAAPRPQILSAAAALRTAITTFEAAQTRTLHFSVAEETKNTFSRMETYFQKPAKLSAQDKGTLKASFTILKSSSVPEFKVKVNDEFVETEVISENTDANTRVVSFEIENLSSLLEAQVRTVVPEQNYDRTHTVRLNFNGVDNTSLSQLIQAAKTAHDAAVVGTQPNQYPAFSKSIFLNAIQAAEAEAVRIPAAQTDTAAAHLLLQRAFDTFKSSSIAPGPGTGTPDPVINPVYPADGQYFMNYRVLRDGTEESSVMIDYVVTTALVTVSGSSKTVSFTVKQSKEITGLTVNGSSGTISHNDVSNNTRIVTFQLSDLSAKIPGWVKIDWPQIKYFFQYDVQYKFDESSARYAGTNASVPGASGHQGPPPGLEVPGTGTPNQDNDGEQEEVPDTEAEPTQSDGQPIIPSSPSNPGNPVVQFKDTATNWAKNNIERAIRLGIASGYQDGSFRPNGTVTRAEFAAFLSRALKLPSSSVEPEFGDFTQTVKWAKPYIAAVVDAGLINGYADQTFRAGHAITRAELAVIISRAAGLQMNVTGALLPFKDSADVPAWAVNAISAAVEAGLLQGKGDNSFDPNGQATRAEALTMIIRLLDYKSKSSSVDTNKQVA